MFRSRRRKGMIGRGPVGVAIHVDKDENERRHEAHIPVDMIKCGRVFTDRAVVWKDMQAFWYSTASFLQPLEVGILSPVAYGFIICFIVSSSILLRNSLVGQSFAVWCCHKARAFLIALRSFWRISNQVNVAIGWPSNSMACDMVDWSFCHALGGMMWLM